MNNGMDALYRNQYNKEYGDNKRIAERYGAGTSEYETATKRNQEIRDMFGIKGDAVDYNKYMTGLANSGNNYTDEAQGALFSLKAKKYNDSYKSESDKLYNQLKNFNYNPENDVSYKAYEKMYTRLGKQATNQALASATKLSSGRNNSWATAAAAQAGQEYMGRITDMIPQLAEQAYNRLYQQYQLNNQRSADEYSKFNDDYNRTLDFGRTMYDVGTAEQDRTINELLTGQQLDTSRLQNEALVMQNDYNREAYKQSLESGRMSIEQAALDLATGKITLEYLPQQLQQQIALTAAEIKRLNGY